MFYKYYHWKNIISNNINGFIKTYFVEKRQDIKTNQCVFRRNISIIF